MISFRPVLQICGLLMLVMAAVMIFPALADAAADNPDWVVFVASAATTAFIGGALYLATRTGEPVELSRRQAFLLTTSAWGLVSLVSTLPLIFYSGNLSLADAFFETVSGITTTGSTVLTGLETLPPGILLWRSMLQWVGAVGIILMAIVMLPFLGVGGMALFETESSEQSGRIVPRSRQFVADLGQTQVVDVKTNVATAEELEDAAAVGALAEEPELFGRIIILVGLAEGIAIYGLIVAILILNRLG